MGKFEDTINNAIKEAKEQLEYAKKTEKKNKELRAKYPDFEIYSSKILRDLGFKSVPFIDDSIIDDYKEVKEKKIN